MLSLAAIFDWEMAQFDVKTAFLYGKLDFNIYMEVPEGLAVDGKKNVCLLKKALYGLKQEPRCWYETFSNFVHELGFKECIVDNSLYIGKIKVFYMYIILFVDDGLVLSSSLNVLNFVINSLKKRFEITIYTEPSTFLGVQISRNRKSREIYLHQNNYINKILEKFKYHMANAVDTPMICGLDLPVSRSIDKKYEYREAIGSLMFLTVVTRSDIAFAVNYLSRYLNCYAKEHWEAVTRVFRYLRGTSRYGLKLSGNDAKLESFCDSDYAGDKSKRKSTSGCVLKIGDETVTWGLKKQGIVALSTTVAEYVSAFEASREVVWVRQLLREVGHRCKTGIPFNIDNQSALRLIKNPEFHKRSKHIEVQFHYVRRCCKKRKIDVKYIPTKDNVFDVITKALSKPLFEKFRDQLEIVDLSDYCKFKVPES